MELSTIQSIVMYLSFFGIELFLAKLIQSNYNKKQYHAIKYDYRNLYINLRLLILELIFMMVYVFIFTVRNYRVGTDTEAYYRMYNYITNNNLFIYNISVQGLSYSYELLYSLVVNLAKIIFNSFQGFLGLMAFIQLVFFQSFCKNSVKEYKINFNHIVFLFFMLLFSESFNIMRQTIAISIVFFGLKYLYQKNLKMYCISIIVASLFHISAIFTILFYFIYDIEGVYSQMKETLLVLGCLLFPVLYSKMMMFFASFPFMQKYTSLYMQSDITSGHANFALLNLLLRIPIVVLLLLYHRSLIRVNKKNRFLFILYIFEIGCFLLSIWYHWTFRMAYYGMCADFILIPQIIKMNRNKNYILQSIIILYYILFFFITIVQRNYNGIIPYIFN